MSEHDNFEDRLRALADQVSRSLQRVSEVDLEELAERYGVDADRARTLADAAGHWLNDQLSSSGPLFGSRQPQDDGSDGPGASEDLDALSAQSAKTEQSSTRPGPHPLDFPTGRQGLALSALDSGRWAVAPGSSQLASTGEGPPPADAPDLVSELRARDWITADGTLTLVGRHALARWCRAVDDTAGQPPEPDTPTIS
jgi:hypothetical protein